MVRSRILCLLAAALFAAAQLCAQVSGRVTGTILDSSGAAVPEATVMLQLPGSGTAVYTTKTSSAGDFTILTVNPVEYDLVVESTGFLSAKVAGIKVDPGRATDVPAIKLAIAGSFSRWMSLRPRKACRLPMRK